MTLQGTRYPILFTSDEEMDRQISVSGVEWHVDDQSDDADVRLEVRERATGTAKAKLNKLFADSDLANSPWVRHRVTIIACYYLSIRRGNVSIYESMHFEALDDFDKLINGEYFIQELPVSNSPPIMVQNYRTDNRFPFTPVRVDLLNSTKTVAGQTNLIGWVPFPWL
jgi:hypothetical protein